MTSGPCAPVFNAPGKPDRKHADDLRPCWNAMLYIAQTASAALPPGVVRAMDEGLVAVPRLSRNVAGPDGAARSRTHRGRKRRRAALDCRHRHPPRPRRLERWVHLPRPGRSLWSPKGAKRVVAVDVTGLPVVALVVPTSTHESRAGE